MTEMNVEEIIPKDKKVVIDGIDLSEYVVSLTINDTRKGINDGSINFSFDVTEVFTLESGQTIEIWTGYAEQPLKKRMYGVIVSIEEDYSGFKVSCADELWKAGGETIIKIYDSSRDTDTFGGDYKDIFVDIVQESGLQSSRFVIDDTDVVIPLIICDNVKGLQKIEEMSNILNWRYFQDPESRLINNRNPANFLVYDTPLEINRNIGNPPKYKENIFQVVNVVEIQGVEAYPVLIEEFTGNGTDKEFIVGKKPFATYVQVEVNGVTLIGSLTDEQVPNSNYLINKVDGKIIFKIAPTNGAAIKVTYTYPEVTNVVVDDIDSIEQYGVRKLVLRLNDVISLDDALERGESIIKEAKNGFLNFGVQGYNLQDLTTHHRVNYKDPILDKDYVSLEVVSIKWKWPEPYEEIQVGKPTFNFDNLINSVEERIKKLERIRMEGTVLTVNKSFNAEFYPMIEDVEIYTDDSYYETEYMTPNSITYGPDWTYNGTTYGITLSDPYTSSSNFIITDFGFNIPSNARINGIQLRINENDIRNEYLGEGFLASSLVSRVYITLSNGEIFDTKSRQASGGFGGLWGSRFENWIDMTFGTSLFNQCYWGDYLTGSDINSPEFGFILSCNSNAPAQSAGIYKMEVKVFYMLDGEQQTHVKRKYKWETNEELEEGLDITTSGLVINNTFTTGNSTELSLGGSVDYVLNGTDAWVGTKENILEVGPNIVAMLDNNDVTHSIDITNFSFPVLSGTIKGIYVLIGVPEFTNFPGHNDYMRDTTIQLLHNNVVVGINKAKLDSWGGEYGTSTDLWGTTLTMENIADASFGIRIQGERYVNGVTSEPIGLDFVKIKIYYEE